MKDIIDKIISSLIDAQINRSNATGDQYYFYNGMVKGLEDSLVAIGIDRDKIGMAIFKWSLMNRKY